MTHKPSEYHLLFQASSLSLLFSDICLLSYDSEDSIAFSRDKSCEWFIHKSRLIAARQRAKDLYRNKETVEAFCADLDATITAFRGFTQQSPTAMEVERFLTQATEIFVHYSKFSPTYTDSLFERENTQDLQVLVQQRKDSYRLVINELFFEESGSFQQFMTNIARVYSVPVEELYFSTRDDIKNLVMGGSWESRGTDGDDYLLSYQGGTQDVRYAQQATALIENFSRVTHGDITIGEVKGVSASKKGVYTGTVARVSMDYEHISECIKRFEGVEGEKILVTETTVPEMVPLMSRSIAIVTNIGGLLSHAAIVSRELGLPCIIGTKTATQVFKDGDMVEVDANMGIVRKI
jgi:phosphoenolpyruvate synthase/pyruvate phosphate dikinase